jgi:Domain of unknown function (DUF4148)
VKKLLIAAAVIASVIAAPTIAFAQAAASLTRAEVKAQLIQLEQAGYKPTSGRNTYPRELQAAETRVSAKSENETDVSYGASSEGTSASGVVAVSTSAENSRSVYDHH